MQTAREIHEEAKSRAIEFKASHSKLLEILMRVDRHRIFAQFGYPSLHVYCTEWLGLTDSDAYALSGVAKKAQEIPEIKTLIDEGKLHVSNARRIVPVITPENQAVWLEKASTLTQNELRREIVTVHPELEKKERIKPVTDTRSRLEVGISKSLESKLKRVCDILSQKKRKAVSLEEALDYMTEGFLEKNDPVKKAERNLGSDRAPKQVKAGRFTCARVAHGVSFRDRGQCTHIYPNGKRCEERRWVERHHIKPVSQGGMSLEENLITLCSAHHKFVHRAKETFGSRGS